MNWMRMGGPHVRVIDCTLTIDAKTKWPGFPRSLIYGRPESEWVIEPVATVRENHVQSNRFVGCTQHFTHIDAPSHFFEGATPNDEVPPQRLVAEAVVFDMMHKNANEKVSAQDLQSTGRGDLLRPGDIAIIRTGWVDKMFGTLEFWSQMIWLTTDAADWLIKRGVAAVASDFMQCDPPLNPPEGRKHGHPDWSPNHKKFLSRGIIMQEFCCNLHQIQKARVLWVCAPMKLRGTDGAPARCFAIELDSLA
jgi:arylformamidase